MSEKKATRPALRVGQVWRTRGGKQCTIKDISFFFPFPIQSDLYGGHCHYADGSTCLRVEGFDYEDDLIELISDAPTTSDPAPVRPAPSPAPAPINAEFFPSTPEILEPIRTGACPFYVLVVSDDAAGKPGGSPIVWEHSIPRSTTLQAALQQQQRVGGRYGTTYLVECRIIPELTRHAA
jgi:hypothetical protein